MLSQVGGNVLLTMSSILVEPHPNGTVMEHALEQRIRQRAYEIWDALGRPEGDRDQHWLTAEREILAVSVQKVARPIAKKMPSTRKTSRQAKLGRARAGKWRLTQPGEAHAVSRFARQGRDPPHTRWHSFRVR
jgi:hypothetical protein